MKFLTIFLVGDWKQGGVVCLIAQLSPLFETPWTAACQAPLSMGILQARILEWVAMPSPGYLPDPGIEPRSPILQADSLLGIQV